MRIIHNINYDVTAQLEFRKIIYQNIVRGMKVKIPWYQGCRLRKNNEIMTWSILHFYLCCMTVSRFWLTPKPNLKSPWATQLIGFMATRSVLRSFNGFPSQFVSLNHSTLFDMKILSFSAPSLRWHINVKQCELSSGDFFTICFIWNENFFCVDLFHVISLFSVQDNADEPLVRRGDPDGISEVHFFIPYFIFGGFYWRNKPSPFIGFVFVMYLHWFFPGEMNTSWLTQCSIS